MISFIQGLITYHLPSCSYGSTTSYHTRIYANILGRQLRSRHNFRHGACGVPGPPCCHWGLLMLIPLENSIPWNPRNQLHCCATAWLHVAALLALAADKPLYAYVLTLKTW